MTPSPDLETTPGSETAGGVDALDAWRANVGLELMHPNMEGDQKVAIGGAVLSLGDLADLLDELARLRTLTAPEGPLTKDSPSLHEQSAANEGQRLVDAGLVERLQNPSPDLIELMCQAREIVPDIVWTDARSEGVISIERMLAERQLKALAATLTPGDQP